MQTACLAPIIAFSGIFAGLIIGKLAKEEIPQYKRQIEALRKIILLIAIAYCIAHSAAYALKAYDANVPIASIMYAFYAIAGAIAGIIIIPRISMPKEAGSYMFLGMIMAASLSSKHWILAAASLVFFYGFPEGSRMQRDWEEFAMRSLAFFLSFLIIIFVPSIAYGAIMGFSAAALAFSLKRHV